MSYLATLTPEQRATNLEKARQARGEQKAKWKAEANRLKQDFADDAYWRKLASKYQVRMPSTYVPGSEFKVIRKAARKMGLDFKELREETGGIESLHELNPTWPAFTLIGLLLEMAEKRAFSMD